VTPLHVRPWHEIDDIGTPLLACESRISLLGTSSVFPRGGDLTACPSLTDRLFCRVQILRNAWTLYRDAQRDIVQELVERGGYLRSAPIIKTVCVHRLS
jgi:hypothetical protein